MSTRRTVDEVHEIGAPRADSGSGLIELAREGNHDAFGRLVEMKLERAFRTASAVLGNEADARDATQEAFVAAWRNLPRLRDVEKFDAWLHRLLINSCRDIQRRRHRVREIALDSQPLTVPAGDERTAERLAVSAALDRLSVNDRAMLVLHHVEGLPVAEVARRLGVPVGTAKWRLHQARRALEKALGNDR
ncbi:MAG: RNA polymerase sigma factor [Chloroflexota bacterium]